MALVIQQEGSLFDELYDQLEKAMAEATSLRQEAFEESQKRHKAEKDLIKAHRRVTAVESAYTAELKQRKEIEAELLREKKELEESKEIEAELLREKQEFEEGQNQREEAIKGFCDELHKVLDTHVSDSEYVSGSEEEDNFGSDDSDFEGCEERVKGLVVKMVSVMRHLVNFKKERHKLQIKLDIALKLTEELMQNQTDSKGEAPEYFICPILQDVMKDPHVAADGFSYDAEAFREWLDTGHDTSPMTNLQLAHTNLVPNHTLRSGIQEWLQRQ